MNEERATLLFKPGSFVKNEVLTRIRMDLQSIET